MKVNLKKLNGAIKKLPKKDIDNLAKAINKVGITKKNLKEFSEGDFSHIEDNPNYEWESFFRTLTKVLLPLALLLNLGRNSINILQLSGEVTKDSSDKYKLIFILGLMSVGCATIAEVIYTKKYFDELDTEDSIPNQIVRLNVNFYRHMWDDFSNVHPIDFFRHMIQNMIQTIFLRVKFFVKVFKESTLYKVCVLLAFGSLISIMGIMVSTSI